MTAALEGGERSSALPGRTLPPGKTRYPLYRRLGGPQGRSGRAENLAPHTCNVCGRNLITRLTSSASPRVDISSTWKVGQKRRVSLPLLRCSPSAWPSRLLYGGGRKSRRDLWITLYKFVQWTFQLLNTKVYKTYILPLPCLNSSLADSTETDT